MTVIKYILIWLLLGIIATILASAFVACQPVEFDNYNIFTGYEIKEQQ